jgi:hypothetical protein
VACGSERETVGLGRISQMLGRLAVGGDPESDIGGRASSVGMWSSPRSKRMASAVHLLAAKAS